MSLRGDDLRQGAHFSANPELYSESRANSAQLSNFRKHDSWKEPCLSQIRTHPSPLPYDWLWAERYGYAAKTRGHYIPQGRCTSSLGRSASVRNVSMQQNCMGPEKHSLHVTQQGPLWNGRGDSLCHILTSPTLVHIRSNSTEVSGDKPV